MRTNLLIATALSLALISYAGATVCGTPFKAKKTLRSVTGCKTNWFGFKYCESEGWENGGCLQPYHTSGADCKTAPMSNPISYYTYRPSITDQGCTCVVDYTVTPSGQQKGIAFGTCGAPSEPDPENPEEPGGN